MEAFENYNPHLFPRLERVGAFLGKIWNLGRVTELCTSEHIREPESQQLTLDFED